MTRAIAQVLTAPGSVPVPRAVEIPDPTGSEVLVRVEAAGICHTDLTFAGIWPVEQCPVVVGHEGAGVVEAVGPDVRTLAVGDRVSLTFDSCGACAQCVARTPSYCDHGWSLNLDGRAIGMTSAEGPVTAGFFGQSSFAQLALASERNTVPIGDLPFAVAAPLGCSVQTGVGAVTRALQPRPGQSVAVFGVGAVGMSAVMGARLAEAETIIAVDPRADRRELALRLGATHAVEAGPDATAAVIELTGGGAHAAVDTTAIPAVLDQALNALRRLGALAVLGVGAEHAELPVRTIMAHGLLVVGVMEGDSDPAVFIPELAAAAADGRLPLQEMITTFGFDDFGDAWEAAESGSAVKPVVVPGA